MLSQLPEAIHFCLSNEGIAVREGPQVATTELEFTEDMQRAIDFAFDQARSGMESDGGISPFMVACSNGDYVVSEHAATSTDAVYDSVTRKLAELEPESYALAYDGFVETDQRSRDAVLVEAANRGDDSAYLFALPYTRSGASIQFDDSYVFVGPTSQLYPVDPFARKAFPFFREHRADRGDESAYIEVEDADA